MPKIDLIAHPVQPQLGPPERGYGCLRVVVGGWPRSGTGWLTEVIEACGFRCGHEQIFSRAGVNERFRPIDVEVSGFAGAHLESLKDQKIVLLTRHPADLFGSITVKWHEYLGDTPGPSLAERWVQTMEAFLDHADIVVKTEDLWEDPRRVARMLEHVGLVAEISGNLKDVKNPGGSTRGGPPKDWCSRELARLALHLGYWT